MKVYVSTYKKYNEGSLKGAWIDLEDFSSKEEFLSACRELHKDESDPEFMFQDSEGVPASLISESWISKNVFELPSMDVEDLNALTVFIDSQSFSDNVSADEIIEAFNDCYRGQYDRFIDFVYEFIDETGMLDGVPKSIRAYFDYDKFSRDLEFDYDYIDGFIFLKN